MKVCKLCGSTYGDRVDFCFRDGQPLIAQEVEVPADVPTPARHAPGLADMLDVPEPAFVQRPTGPGLADPTALPSPSGFVDADKPPDTPTAFDFGDGPDAPSVSAEDDIEVLTPPEPLDRPGLDAPVDSAAVHTEAVDSAVVDSAVVDSAAGPVPTAPQAVDPADPFPSNLDSTAAGLSDVAVPPVDLSGGEDLPGPKEIDDGLDTNAMADIARTLSAPETTASTPAPSPAEAAPALDDLVDAAPVEHDADDDIVSYIGAGGSTTDSYDFEDDEPARGSDNKLVFVLFAAAILLAVVAGGFMAMNKKDAPDDPLAGKPEEVAAPVVEAPAPPPPAPVGDAADATAADGAAADATAADGTAADATAADGTAADGGDAVANLGDGGAGAARGQPEHAAGDADQATADTEDAPAAHAPASHASSSHPSTSTSTSTTSRASAPASSSATSAPAATSDTPSTTGPDASTDATTANGSDATADVSTDSPWQTEVASGRLTVNTVPSGAQVSIDGRPYGNSPLSAELEYGMHTIRVALGGYTSEARTIDVEVPDMAVPFELKPLVVTGTVNIFGPTGSTVLVDGTQVGKIPTSVKLTEGTHTFRVETSEGTSFTRSQDVRFDSGTTVSVTLSP